MGGGRRFGVLGKEAYLVRDVALLDHIAALVGLDVEFGVLLVHVVDGWPIGPGQHLPEVGAAPSGLLLGRPHGESTRGRPFRHNCAHLATAGRSRVQSHFTSRAKASLQL